LDTPSYVGRLVMKFTDKSHQYVPGTDQGSKSMILNKNIS